jgi:hypothetical protein
MNRKYTIISFLLLAALFIFAQAAFLITAPEPAPLIADWAHKYRWTSSLEVLGVVALLILAALVLQRYQSQYIYWVSFLLILFVAWFYLGRELWAHFVEIPKMLKGVDFPRPPYFSFAQPWVAVPRLMWHILIPISIAFSFSLLVKNRKIEQGGAANPLQPSASGDC